MAIALDAMGGDYGARVLIEGAVAAARQWGIETILVGPEKEIAVHLDALGAQGLPISIRNATQVVEMGESPAEALRKKKDSSIRIAFDLAKAGVAEAVVSAGNSGATLATAMVTLGRIHSVRPAIATVMPTLKRPVVMIDVGANVDCKPHHLLQFGVMGAIFSRHILSIENPRVGLLSIGEEGYKGNVQVKKAYDLFSASKLNFLGNVEGRDVFKGDVDVIVCDGFIGNICLKLSEGLAESILAMLKTELSRSNMGRLGYLLAKGPFRVFRKKVDYSEYGGAPLLGINGIVIISHGRSGPKAVKNAIYAAHRLARQDLVTYLKTALKPEDALLQALEAN